MPQQNKIAPDHKLFVEETRITFYAIKKALQNSEVASVVKLPGDQKMTQDSSFTGSAKVRILLVDDHAVLRQALTEVLSVKGRFAVVGEASDGSELLELAPRVPADIILLDLAMPKTNGITTIEELKKMENVYNE